MNKPKLNVPNQGRRASDAHGDPISTPANLTIADAIFSLIGETEGAGKTLTVWDLRRILDLPLHDVFVGLRALEFDRLVCRGVPAQDPLSAPVSLTERGREVYFRNARISLK